MTADQFAALAQLMAMRHGPSQDAARLVLVDGLSSSDAARQCGITPQGVSNAVVRARQVLELARAAVGDSSA